MRVSAHVEDEELAKAKGKLEEFLADIWPAAKWLDITLRPMKGPEGEAILFVLVVLDAEPTAADVPRQIDLRHKFSTWLLQEAGDER
ncbi:MAG: hypothetical protein ACRD1F_07800, partial [Terriglobales bacterium]